MSEGADLIECFIAALRISWVGEPESDRSAVLAETHGRVTALPMGKDSMVKGDIASIQAVVVGTTYDGKGKWDGDVKTLAPEDRPMK